MHYKLKAIFILSSVQLLYMMFLYDNCSPLISGWGGCEGCCSLICWHGRCIRWIDCYWYIACKALQPSTDLVSFKFSNTYVGFYICSISLYLSEDITLASCTTGTLLTIKSNFSLQVLMNQWWSCKHYLKLLHIQNLILLQWPLTFGIVFKC